MPWYLYLALKQLFPSGRRLGSLFFALSVLGVALGVAVLVVVQSVMGGFGEIHRERIIDTTGHLDINEGGYPFGDYGKIEAHLKDNLPEVDGVTPYAQGFVMVQRGRVPSFPFVYGLDMQESPVFNVKDYMVSGTLDDLYDDTVLVSQKLANQLGLMPGSEVEVYSPLMIERLKSEEMVLPRELEVVGIYNVDWNQDFIPGMITTLRTMQDLYGLEGEVHGIAVRLHDGADEFVLANQLRDRYEPGKWIETWRGRWADFLWVLDLEKTMMLFINLFIIAVAVFAIAIAQLLTVVRKTREIGLLNVIGGKQRHVLGLYCFQGFIIGVLGLVTGVGMALLLLSFRDPIIHQLSSMTGTRETLTQYYYFANLPVKYAAMDFVVISIAAVGLSTLASLLPAWRASRLKPADTLRIEQ